eukprot:scaffold248408_cov103-Cyclotella_meneghiniana.AAC.6
MSRLGCRWWSSSGCFYRQGSGLHKGQASSFAEHEHQWLELWFVDYDYVSFEELTERFVVKTAVGIAEYIGWGRPSPPWLMGIIDIIVVRVWEVQSLCDVFYHVVGHCCEFSIESSFPVIPIVW